MKTTLTQKHLNSYETEADKDKLINSIKMICLSYLDKSDNIKHINTEKLENYFKYIEMEYNEISSLKYSLKVKSYHKPYNEIYSRLDDMIVADNLLSKDERIIFIELTKDINYLEDTLAFCYGILFNAISSRKDRK